MVGAICRVMRLGGTVLKLAKSACILFGCELELPRVTVSANAQMTCPPPPPTSLNVTPTSLKASQPSRVIGRKRERIYPEELLVQPAQAMPEQPAQPPAAQQQATSSSLPGAQPAQQLSEHPNELPAAPSPPPTQKKYQKHPSNRSELICEPGNTEHEAANKVRTTTPVRNYTICNKA